MKLEELLQEERLADYLKRLVKSHNVKQLGGGAYSQVFQHPEFGNVITKVYTAKDTKYARYLKWVMSNQNNPYVPQIIEQVKYKSPTGDAYNIVFMEKLEPVKRARQYMDAWLGAFEGITKEEETGLYDAIKAMNMVAMFSQLRKLIPKYGDEDLKKVWNHIKTFGARSMDLHPGNVMLKGKQLVITDPVAADVDGTRVDSL